MTATVTSYYPRADTLRYSRQEEETAKRAIVLLFTPERLGEVVHNDFVELEQDGSVALEGLHQLQEYRRRFGNLVLLSLRVIFVPPDMAMRIPGTPGERYTVDLFFEAEFLLPVDGPLPPGSPAFPAGTPPIRIRIRMREPYLIRLWADPNQLGTLPRHMVFGRSYEAAGEVTMLEPHGQHGFVVRQLWYYWRFGRTMIEAGIMRPFEDIVREAIPDAFTGPQS